MRQPGEVELVDCTKRFAETVAVDGINLKIPAGTYCCCWDRADAARRQFCA
jgi:putative spermidine/putrescine transport system ATP-binding protein